MADDAKCICAQVCDCQSLPPDDNPDQEGSWGISTGCPAHNDYPDPNPECQLHSHLGPIDFYIATGR